MKFNSIKNISIRSFGLFISLILSLIFFLTCYLILIHIRLNSIWFVYFSTLVFFLISFFIIYYSFNTLYFRKIKLIYKLITEKKFSDSTTSGTSQDMSLNLTKVENNVEDWIKLKNKEFDQMKELEKYRRDYLGNVSHELKTPIFNIQGFLETVLNDQTISEEQKSSFLSKALKNAYRIQHIVEDLNIVDKLESGQKTLDLQNFQLRNLIDEVIEENLPFAQKRNIRIEFKKGADHNYIVLADKEHIRIALNNIISNSIKYGKQNGFTKIGLYDLENVILLEVSDNGIGISESHLKHVFDRFYRIEQSRARNETGGSGIGLSIVKHIIESHGQKIHVRSKEGVGSTFGFTLEKS